MSAPVNEILGLVGPATLVRLAHGQKCPIDKHWDKLVRRDMTDKYLAGFNGHNVGVSLGVASDGLCTVDADNGQFLEAFLIVNHNLRESLISHGARGGNVWIRLKDKYPPAGKIKTADGKPWGEWRADGNQTVIHGVHPSGCEYRNNGKAPMEISFDEINWPEGLILPWRRQPDQKPQQISYTANDAGRAQRFVDRYEENIRYVPEHELWLTWQDDRWKPGRAGGMERMAVALSREMLADAAKIEGTDTAASEARKAATKEALAFGDRYNISNILTLAQIDLRVILDAKHLDSDPWIVGARNAVIDLRTGAIRKDARSDYITRTLGVDADLQATCPRWQRFIDEIFPDPDVARFVWKAAGYSLTGLTKEQCFFFLYGTGANGKSTMLETQEAIFGTCAERWEGPHRRKQSRRLPIARGCRNLWGQAPFGERDRRI